MEEEPTNQKFLSALIKTRTVWESDEKFTRIFQKMERGKNLKRDEFARVYFMIREMNQY